MAWRHEGSRHERGYGYQWTKRRENVMRRDGYLCQPCMRQGRPTPADEVDHITPKSQDGTDDYDNLEAICRPCHSAKTANEARTARGARSRPTIGVDGWPVG
ncbi:HNH endonuclease [Sulfitobacter sp. HI0054]|uniref:HNH endonuclease n=1 Tax=Sulfitobacter sp. HI0054 TaxID=1822238 RepID=UPI0009EE34AA